MAETITFPDRLGALARMEEAYAEEHAAAQAYYQARDTNAPDKEAAAERWAAAIEAARVARAAVPTAHRATGRGA